MLIEVRWQRARNSSRSGSRMHDRTAGTSGPHLTERQHLRERGPRACPRRSTTPNAVITPTGGRSYSGKPRPGYRALLDDVEHGRADAVLAWHTDRLHRRPVELEEYIDVCDRHGVITQTVKAGPLDLATPSGRMVARMLGSGSRYEVEHMTCISA